MVDRNKLNSILEFTYIRSTISSNGCIGDEIQRRMAKPGASFGRLRQRLWNNHHVSYTEPRPGRQVKKLQAFMMRHLRPIMRITWMDKVINKDILERTGLPSRGDLMIRKNLRWTEHLMRPKEIIYSQLSSGLWFKDTIKRNLKLRDIKTDSWTSRSQQRDKWAAIIK